VILNYCRGFRGLWLSNWKKKISVIPVERSSAKCGAPARWCTPHIGLVLSENFLTCIFLGARLGSMGQFRGLRAHRILRRLISSCEDALRTCLQDPCDVPRLTETQNCCCDRNNYTANAGERLKENWIPLRHLRCHERPTCWSCLVICSIDSIDFFYLVCETIGNAATPGLLCQPRVIVKMIVESTWNVDW
jgi:hypothetical protein